MKLHIQTPLFESLPLSISSKTRVWLKMEALQPTGSFKIRGIGHACDHYRQQGAEQFVSSSGGNAGIAVAHAGRHLGMPVTVVVPDSTTKDAVTAIRREGAEVVIIGESWQEAHDHCLQIADGRKRVLIHPFDDPLLWAGHATLIDEIVDAGLIPDVVILSVGGGGLLCGVVEGLCKNGLHTTPIIAIETRGAHSLNEALAQGHLTALEKISSIASSLGAKAVAQQAFEFSRQFPILSHVVSDREALNGCQQFLADHRILVEPACGASISLLLQPSDLLRAQNTVLLIVCGGVGVSVPQLTRWVAQVS